MINHVIKLPHVISVCIIYHTAKMNSNHMTLYMHGIYYSSLKI